MRTLVLIALPDALPSCLAGWEDLFEYANRLSVRRGGPSPFQVGRWVPGTPPPPAPDAVLIPARVVGGPEGDTPDAPPSDLGPVVRRWTREGALVTAVCAGVLSAAEVGLLDGRRATTHWSLAEAAARRFPRVQWQPEALVIDEEDRLLGGGMTAFYDVGLRLIQRFAGPETARDCAAVFVLDPHREYQTPFVPVDLGTETDPLLAKAVAWALDQPTLGFSVAEWAKAVAVEKRTLERRAASAWGFGPAERLRRIRLDRARALVLGSTLPWDEVSRRCGYQDPGALRRIFLGRLGLTPGEYRRRFG